MNVELSLEALDDLAEILTYVGGHNPRAAFRLVDGIEQTCERLGRIPLVGTIRDDLKPGLRAFTHGSYVIYFRRKTDETLRIVRVVHGARDMKPSDF